MRVYEAVGAMFDAAGIEAVFGLMGDGNLRFVSHLQKYDDITFYAARHENTAVAMAHGYARSTGRAGICTLTQGPGLTNGMTALAAAVKARIPMVLVTGDTPAAVPEHIQAADLEGLIRRVGAGYQPLEKPERIWSALDLAIHRARRERRPIGLTIPTDWQETAVGEMPDRLVHADEVPLEPVAEALEAAVELIAYHTESNGWPLIVAGQGAVFSGAEEVLQKLADDIGALLATTVQGKGLFARHPYHIGIAGSFASDSGSECFPRADLVLAFGASLNYWTTAGGELFPEKAHIIHCDDDAGAIGAHAGVTLGLHGDARVTAERLRTALRKRGIRQRVGFRSEVAAESIDAYNTHALITDGSSAESVDPRTLTVELDRLLPRERSVAVDGGHFTGFPTMRLRVPDPAGFCFAVNFGAVGLGLGSAMGTAVGRPERLAVATLGDGGALMTLGDIETAVRHGLRLLVVIYNDGAYGAELHHLDLLQMASNQAVFGYTDFAACAKTLGARGITVKSVKDLAALEAWLDAPDGVCVVDARVARHVRARWLEHAVRPQMLARAGWKD